MAKSNKKFNSNIEKHQLEDDKSLTFPIKNPIDFTRSFSKIKHKYRAKITERDGKKFASKAEARFYDSLKLLQKSGEVLFFLQQVPFHLPGNTKYLADFMVFYADGNCSVIDVKGRELPMSIMKKKQVEELYPITIEIVHF